jgi:hypothetical protein
VSRGPMPPAQHRPVPHRHRGLEQPCAETHRGCRRACDPAAGRRCHARPSQSTSRCTEPRHPQRPACGPERAGAVQGSEDRREAGHGSHRVARQHRDPRQGGPCRAMQGTFAAPSGPARHNT